VGSIVFNLAALLGLGAVVAGRIGLHRKMVLLGGVLSPAAGCLAGLVVVPLYAAVPAAGGRALQRLPLLPRPWAAVS
jgi:hypothetical protein